MIKLRAKLLGKTLLLSATTCILGLTSLSGVYAQVPEPDLPPLGPPDVPKIEPGESFFADKIAPAVFGIAFALSVLFIVIGGFKYIMASGDPHNVEVAKHTILYAVIGLIVTISAWAIVEFVLKAGDFL